MTTHTPETEHVAFDAMCAQVEDYETLPTVRSSSPEQAREADVDVDEQVAPIDGLILAGLVSP